LRQLQRLDEALTSFDRAIALNPGLAHAHYNRAVTLQDLGRCEEAVSGYRAAIGLEPRRAELLNDLGTALLELSRYEEALASFDRALTLSPGLFGAMVNRGSALNRLGRFDEALEAYDRALGIAPAAAQLHANRGHLLHDAGHYQEALASYDRALELEPDQPLVQWNKGLINLLFGDFAEGWRLYESRWQSYARDARRNFPQPLWLGQEPLQGKTLLLHAEQGFGDTIQFCRFVAEVQRLGAEIVLEAPAQLLPVLATLPGRYRLVARGTQLPDFELHCPLLSLPLVLGTRLDTIPAGVPYLGVDRQKRQLWEQRLGPRFLPRIGLVWAGSSRHLHDGERSLPLPSLEPLLKLGFEFHCLQKEISAQDRELLADLPQLRRHDTELEDFSDTAALVSAMDLVLSVDTAVAHLAGALGKPVWILLAHAPDFRWMLERKDSPWYLSALLFRQSRRGDWAGVIGEVLRRLDAEFGLTPQ
jgi:Tfp pilus assembly protein PilF